MIPIYAQTQNWVYSYHNGYNDKGYSIIQGRGGNIYAAGESWGDNRYDFVVVSLNTAGVMRWVYRYDGPGRRDDFANKIIQGKDGYLYVVGASTGSGTATDITVISLDTLGSPRWIYRYNGSTNQEDVAYTIIQGRNGNLYLVGYSDLYPVVISLTPSGAERWVYYFTANTGFAYNIVQTTQGDLVVSGTYYDGSDYDFLVIGLTTEGVEQWSYRYEGPGYSTDKALSIAQGSDGNLYIAGYSEGIGTLGDLTVISLTVSGNLRWIYRYNGPDDKFDQAFQIISGGDQNLYIAGLSNGDTTAQDLLVISLDYTGAERWVYRYNSNVNRDDVACSIVEGSDGNVYAAGYSGGVGEDIVVISLTHSGIENWIYRYDGTGNGNDYGKAVCEGRDGNLYITGLSFGGVERYFDLVIISLNKLGVEEGHTAQSTHPFIPLFFTERIYLKIDSLERINKVTLYDPIGKTILDYNFNQTLKEVTISDPRLKKLPAGLYFLMISTDVHMYHFKIVKI
ncbi:hypothetical protein DRP53_01720 [candidate division WOR-3 bacterium]|uniref:T9SS type A sorting domain-containing protein n=1 Tax=candidate division WOR-3 bacterium TaxID=2052148 RepID=A0A660SN36_UNCW3|nr:MAG: hypothetical protein DRP53_01720 [candidate division WOR-3 bacterium]